MFAHVQGYTGPPVAMGHAYFTEAFPSQSEFKARLVGQGFWLLAVLKFIRVYRAQGQWWTGPPGHLEKSRWAGPPGPVTFGPLWPLLH